jgi:hypothetical protein
MARYVRGYEHGLRGYDQPNRPYRARRARADRWGAGEERRSGGFRTPRVTQRYNLDYVLGARGADDYPRNYNPYTGDRPGDIGDPGFYRRPYTTIGGTRTSRGMPPPPGYGDEHGYDRGLRR